MTIKYNFIHTIKINIHNKNKENCILRLTDTIYSAIIHTINKSSKET